ncbi:MAG: hypothetical protein LR008_00245 [Candidatus Pacebacteria bacterium]|nr:hypothetical protein [Candidatus Paceibacterota bacterium]
MNTHAKESGFALLMTLVVVSVVLSVGLSILDLSIKQVKLSSNAKDSEIAFHAANAGMECARYWRRNNSNEMESGQVINPTCFGVGPDTNSINSILPTVITVDGEVNLYTYLFTWGADPRCTQISTLVASSSVIGVGVTTTNMTALIPGYPGGDDKFCEPGARCTVISVQGYNRPCNTATGYGTIQREVLLQF